MSFIKESYLAYKKVQEVLEKETSDHEIAMARSELEGIADKATATSSMLEGMTESGNPLPAWVQSKITNASDYITSVHDYLKYNPHINESVSLEETTFEKIYQMQQDGKSAEDIAKELKLKPDLVKKVLGESKVISEGLSDAQIAQLKKEYEPLKGKTITTSQYQQLKNILFKLQDGDLEKLQKQNIPFASTGAGSILRVRKSPVKITSVKVPGLEGMAEEKIPQDYLDYLRTIVYKKVDFYEIPPKHIIQHWKDEPNKDRFKGKIIDYKEEVEIQESKSSDDAKRQGLEYYGFGRYGKNNVVTHKSINGNLQSLPKNQQTKAGDKETQIKKPVEIKNVIKTIKDLNIDDLKVDDDKKFIHIVKEFDPTVDSIKDAKAEYMDIVKTLNKKGINYKPNANQDIENDKDQEYMQINFSVKKEEVQLQEKPSRKKHVVFKLGDKLVAKDFRGYNDDEIAKSIDDFLKQNSKSIVVQQSPIQSVTEEPKNPYAIGMAAAMKATGDTPPLKKSTITKAHKIADKVKEEEVSKETETEFHKKLDTLVHKTFGKRKDEKMPIKESHFSMGQHVIYKPTSMTPRKAQIIQVQEPQVGAYYKIKISPTLMTYAKPDELELDEACWTGYKQVGLKKKGKRMVPNCVPEERRLYIESIVAVKNKAEKSGMPYSILKQVYDRGMAAWKGGHRPGATQVQWALARVNSFVTKSSGTWGGADSDLAKKVKGD